MIRLLENGDVPAAELQQNHYLKKKSFHKKRHHKAWFDSLSFQKSKERSQPRSIQSLPYYIESEERCGRLLRASRDILAGEVIFTDLQGVVGPRPAETPHPVCLTCYRRLSRLSYRCQHCGWPLCSYSCGKEDNSLHARECSFFRSHRRRYVWEWPEITLIII